jgi:hypothetical protein
LKKIFIVFLLCALSAFAGPITTDQWYGFAWFDPMPSATSGYLVPSADASVLDPGASPWTISLASPAYFVVVDGFESVDQFEVFDGGLSLGLTSSPTAHAYGCSGGNGPEHCLADIQYSRGSFLLGAGDHTINITTVTGFSPGGGWFQVDSGVPEPSTLGLVGLAGLAIIARRRKR